MPLETEAKIKVEQLTPYERRLRELHAQFQGRFRQRDHFFDRPDRSLRAVDSGLRLRQITPETEHPLNVPPRQLCFKGPRRPGRFKQRREIEFGITDADTALEFLQALGFEQTLVFEKRRSLWRLNQCDVCLDQVVRLGYFVEIEGPDEKTILQVTNLLGLQDQPTIQTSYAALLDDLLQRQGTPLPVQLLLET